MKLTRIQTSQFGRRLRTIRTEKYSSLDAFCERFNEVTGEALNKSTVARWEKGEREPMMSYMFLLAQFFAVDPLWLSGLVQNRDGSSDGCLVSTDESEIELLNTYRKLSVRGKTAVLSLAFDLEKGA